MPSLRNLRRTNVPADDLAALPVFSRCSPRKLQRIASLTTWLRVSDGVLMCREGDIDRQFFVIVSGAMLVSSSESRVATLGPGDCVGAGVLETVPRSTSIVAKVPSEVVVCNRREFAALLDIAPEIAQPLLTTRDKYLQRDLMSQQCTEAQSVTRGLLPVN